MIFGGPKPWQSQRQRHLLRACFHVDEHKALGIAQSWFETYNLDDITYPEHRLLTRLRCRFPAFEITKTSDARITGLQRQLWVRGNLNLKAAHQGFAALTEFGIPWMLTGAAAWFVQPAYANRESADLIEFTVPENATSTALHVLVQAGWKAQVTTPDRAYGPVFTQLTKGHGTLRLSHAKPLLFYAPDAQETMWKTRISQPHELGEFYLPSTETTFLMALGKAHSAYGTHDQWVFDLFNLADDPLALLHSKQAPAAIAKRLGRTLNAAFYR